jgi:hypothetical protein
VLFECDSLSVILEFKKEGHYGSGRGQLNFDTELIFSSLASHSFQHVKKDANKATHYITKFALS